MTQLVFSHLDPSFPAPSETITQSEFAQLLGVNQSVISLLIADRVLTPGAGWKTWIKEIYRYRTETAAGRHGEGPLDLVQERARLAHEQADKTNFELRRARGEFLPVQLVVETMDWSAMTIRNRILALPNKLKSRIPKLTATELSMIDDELRALLTVLAQVRLPPKIREHLRLWVEKGRQKHEAKEGSGESIKNDGQEIGRNRRKADRRRPRGKSSKKAQRNRKKNAQRHDEKVK